MALLNAFTIETPEVVGVASDRRGETTLNVDDFGKRALFDGNVTIPLALVADVNRTQTVVNVTDTALTLTAASGVTITGQTTVPPYGVVDLVVLSTTGSVTTWVASEGDADKANRGEVGVRTYASYTQAELLNLPVGTPVLGADLELYKLSADAKAEQLGDAADAIARTSTPATHGQWLLQTDTSQNYYYSTISEPAAWVEWNGVDAIPANAKISPAVGVKSWTIVSDARASTTLKVASKADLPTSTTIGNIEQVRITTPFSGGLFDVTRDDISSFVSADATQLSPIHVPFSDDPTGASGGYVRVFTGARGLRNVEAGWFLEAGGDWARAITAADAYLHGKTTAVEIGEIHLPGHLFLTTRSDAVIRTPYVTLCGNNASLVADDTIDPNNPNAPMENGAIEFHATGASGKDLHITSLAHAFLTGRGQGGTFTNIWAKQCRGIGFLFGGSIHGQVGWAAFSDLIAFQCKGGGASCNSSQTGLPATEHPYINANPFPLVGYNDFPTFEHGFIEAAGSGYTDGIHPVDIVALTGSGEHATAVVQVRGGQVVKITMQACGMGYAIDDTVTISSPATGVETSIGAGTGFVYRVKQVLRLAGQSGNKTWVNACQFHNISIRQCWHYGLQGYGAVQYNNFLGCQIEGNYFTGPTIKGEFGLNYFTGVGHLVQPTVAATGGDISLTQPFCEWVGIARNNRFSQMRITAAEYAGTLEDFFDTKEKPGVLEVIDCQVKGDNYDFPHYTSNTRTELISAKEIVTSELSYIKGHANPLHAGRITKSITTSSTTGHSVTFNMQGFHTGGDAVQLEVELQAFRNLTGNVSQHASGILKLYLVYSATTGIVDLTIGNAQEVAGLTFGTPAISADYIITIPFTTAELVSNCDVYTKYRDRLFFNGTHNPQIPIPTAVTATQNGAVTDVSWTSAESKFKVYRNGTFVADVEYATSYVDTSTTAEARDYTIEAIRDKYGEARSLKSAPGSMTYA